jgi:hypothetical protein
MKGKQVDQTEIKLMQIFVMVVLTIGFIVDSWIIILLQVVLFLLTIINPVLNPFIFIYRVLPRSSVKPLPLGGGYKRSV